MKWLLSALLLFGTLIAANAQSSRQAPPAKGPAPPAAVQIPPDPHATSASYGDWLLACQRINGHAQRLCEVTQSVQVQGQPAPIARLAIAKAVGGAGLRIVLVLPNNITIGADPAVSAAEKDKEVVALSWRRCLPGGCFAEAALSEKIVAGWRAEAGPGQIVFKDGLGRDVTVPFSFRGLAQAADALAKE